MQKIIFLSIGILSLICTNAMERGLWINDSNMISDKYTVCILVDNPALEFTQTFTALPYVDLLTREFSPSAIKTIDTILKNYGEIESPFKIVMQPNLVKANNDLIWYVEYQKKCYEKLIKIKKELKAYIFTKPASRPPREFNEDQGIIAKIMNPILGLCHHSLYEETPIEEVIENMSISDTPHIIIGYCTQNNPAQESPIQKEFLHFIAKGLTLATIDQTGSIKTIVAYYPFKKDREDLSLLETMTIIAKLATFQPY